MQGCALLSKAACTSTRDHMALQLLPSPQRESMVQLRVMNHATDKRPSSGDCLPKCVCASTYVLRMPEERPNLSASALI